MLQLIHNPDCSKSREALDLVRAAALRLGEPLRVREYLREPLTAAELETLLAQLGLPVRELLRSGEALHADLGLDDPALSTADLLAALAAHPRLLQRPVLVRDGRAVIARPPARALALLD